MREERDDSQRATQRRDTHLSTSVTASSPCSCPAHSSRAALSARMAVSASHVRDKRPRNCSAVIAQACGAVTEARRDSRRGNTKKKRPWGIIKGGRGDKNEGYLENLAFAAHFQAVTNDAAQRINVAGHALRAGCGQWSGNDGDSLAAARSTCPRYSLHSLPGRRVDKQQSGIAKHKPGEQLRRRLLLRRKSFSLVHPANTVPKVAVVGERAAHLPTSNTTQVSGGRRTLSSKVFGTKILHRRKHRHGHKGG